MLFNYTGVFQNNC